MTTDVLEDVRAADPVERLLEDSWESRSRRPGRREIVVEAVATVLFLAAAVPLAAGPAAGGHVRLGPALLLMALYALVSRTVKFPLGAGYVVPSYLVLVPMLILLPPTVVPLVAGTSLVLGTLVRCLLRRTGAAQLLSAAPDAWHTLGPAVVLALGTGVHGTDRGLVYVVAFLAGCMIDLLVSTARESLIFGLAPKLQGRVIGVVWLVDAAIAPIGLLAGLAAREHTAVLLLLLPLNLLLIAAERDRTARIEEAHSRLGVVARERTRLQAAVQRLADAFAAKLELAALADVVLHGSTDALDADAGRLTLHGPGTDAIAKNVGGSDLSLLLESATGAAESTGRPCQLEADGGWALALPLDVGGDRPGALAVARAERRFRDDEQALLLGLVERTESAMTKIVAHDLLIAQARTDPLTGLGNRRKLADELSGRLPEATAERPLVVLLFDLDGFKSYNDTFGHVAGDALLARLGDKLAAAAEPHGSAYRLGGDEFCVLLPSDRDLRRSVQAAAGALEEHGETFSIAASCGAVMLPQEATTPDYALQLADKRMYAHKNGRPSGAREQAHDVLIHIMQAKHPDLTDHACDVARLASHVGVRLGMSAEQLDELARAAALHDIGKVGIPDAILDKTGPLNADEWSYMRQHTVIGERILSAAPALRPVAAIVRASHERWDGCGYPDGLTGDRIPPAARVVAVCDAFDAMTTDRCYRPTRTEQEACEELRRGAGHQFDPAVVSAFLAEIDRCDVLSHTRVPANEAPRTERAAEVASRVLEQLPHAVGLPDHHRPRPAGRRVTVSRDHQADRQALAIAARHDAAPAA
ncbi:MAG: diguanylate cyclase [Solirubrobacteraceae bacterium]|jgi:diguanylate cyclase (GGDEF)-like protein